MNTIKLYFKQYLWLIILAGLLLLGTGVYFLGGYLEEKSFDKTVQTQTNQANTAVRESKIESGVAANLSIERRAEDAVRERVIKPKLDDARRRSSNSQSKLATAQKQYENSKKNPTDFNRSVVDNCAQLKRAYPNVTFEYCQP